MGGRGNEKVHITMQKENNEATPQPYASFLCFVFVFVKGRNLTVGIPKLIFDGIRCDLVCLIYV